MWSRPAPSSHRRRPAPWCSRKASTPDTATPSSIATMFRDDALAREIPAGLYVGHVKVEGGSALIQHQEHAPVSLGEGTYRVRRQRELEPKDAVLVSD